MKQCGMLAKIGSFTLQIFKEIVTFGTTPSSP
jgi:hypothetical protein